MSNPIRAAWRTYRPHAAIRTSYLIQRAEKIMHTPYTTGMHVRVAARIYASAWARMERGGRLPRMLPTYRGGSV